jgi:putative PIN family toxin of toxin-antitoxin system
MLKVCLDTNVWISGLAFSGTPAEIVSLAFSRKFQVVTSNLILEELNRNLVKKFGVNPKRAKHLCFRIAQIADVYEPKGAIHAISGNHADNLVLETAVLGRAKYLVTGDREHLLPLKVFRNIKIIEPTALLLRLRN